MTGVEIAYNLISELAECPIWDERLNRICWIDLRRGEIHTLDVINNEFNTINVGQQIGCIALCENGNILAALQSGLGVINMALRDIEFLKCPEKKTPNFRFNDGKCDPLGRFWVGSMSDDEVSGAGTLYMVNHYCEFNEMINNVTIPNGMAWSKDGKIFYFIDTPTFRVMSYTYNIKTGKITDSRAVISIPKSDGFPDGMTIDSDGMLWIAHWDGWQITRWNPVSCEKLFSLKLPVARVTSCVFGGNELSDLYITTARYGLNNRQLKEQPFAGSLFIWKNCGYNGIPSFRFNREL